jgi:hypothetical protein
LCQHLGEHLAALPDPRDVLTSDRLAQACQGILKGLALAAGELAAILLKLLVGR